MIERFSLRLIGGENDEQGILALDEDLDDLCRLTFEYRGKSIDADASDFFEAFCSIRRQLEAEGLMPFCYGASLNVFPSGMARDMGVRGLKAYRLQPGRHARGEDLVFIFDEGADVTPASVEMQEAFFWEWARSDRT